MSNTTTGWTLFIAAMGMMLGLMAVDVSNLSNWNEIFTTAFIGTLMGHMSVVIMAFIGGKLIPTDRDTNMRSRSTDSAPLVEIKTEVKAKDNE